MSTRSVLQVFVLVVALSMASGCGGERVGSTEPLTTTAPPQSRTASTSGASTSGASTSGASTTSARTSGASTTSASASGGCTPWIGARRFVASSVAGRADFSREFRYDFARGELAVSDSDPYFVPGPEQKVAHRIERTISVVGDDKAALEKKLRAVCTSAEAMKRACAPGGCLHLEVWAEGEAPLVVEDHETVGAVMSLLAPRFPELRQN